MQAHSKETELTGVGSHTAGPWKVSNVYPDDIVDHHGRMVASAYGRYVNGEVENPKSDDSEEAANARLIAAAPEMLEALEKAHLHFIQSNTLSVDDREMLDEMWAVIHKAQTGGAQ